jgi:hypothetical protein
VTVVYHLCGYDKMTELLAEEHPVAARLLPMVRTLIKPVAGDRHLVLCYELSNAAVLTLSQALGLSIDPAVYHYYFEGSDASGAGANLKSAGIAR